MRDADLTRQKILEITADEIHKNGFNNTSLSTILKRCDISKGALYHHFANKLELGYAVCEEVYTPAFLNTWQPAVEGDDPIVSLQQFFLNAAKEMTCEQIQCGCPVNNLCQEMATIDEGFRSRVHDMQMRLNTLLTNSLKRIQHQLKDDVDCSKVAYFVVASFHGSSVLNKSAQNDELFKIVIDELCQYLDSLRKAPL